MKRFLLLSSCVGLFSAFVACDDSSGGSGNLDGSASGDALGAGLSGGSSAGGTGAGGTGGTGTSTTGGTGGTSTTGGTGGKGTGGTGGTSGTVAGNCMLPTPVGSCVVPVAGNPMALCQEYYNAAIYTATTIKQICDAVGGTVSTGPCPRTGLLGFCDVAVSGVRSFNQFYYGVQAAGDAFKMGCMNGGAMWCPL